MNLYGEVDVRVRPKVGDRVLARDYCKEGTVIKFAQRFSDDRRYDMALVELDSWLKSRKWVSVDELYPIE